jgi:truncated hemoglobin YjbI
MTAGSTAILHSGNQIHKDQLLAKIGGSAVLHQAVDRFYAKLVQDPRLHEFFAHANLAVLKWHQFNIISFAFTEIPEDFDIEDLILTRHRALFDEGLCESHFDVMMEHFDGTLRELQVEDQVIENAKLSVLHLRDVFQQGARDARQRQLLLEQRRNIKAALIIGISFAVVAFSLMRRKK